MQEGVDVLSVVLYRKYRSQDFNELVGQEHVSQSLQQAIKAGRLSHAYLFTGPRGVGKTSAARILARNINKLNPEEAAKSLDIIEIDAASNRRIDEIRDLREKVHIAPASAPYKVYIIDEVHMLTTEAFNALLKTLEEPPAHVVFILATTEPHKLPATIVSRTQHFSFKPVKSDYVIAHLRKIAEAEKIKINDEALAIIAELGEGSFRDSISLLDQLSTHQPIDERVVVKVAGLATISQIKQLAENLLQKNPKAVLSVLDDLIKQGATPQQISLQLLKHLQELLKQALEDNQAQSGQLASIIKEIATIPSNAASSLLALEATLVKLSIGTEITLPQLESASVPTDTAKVKKSNAPQAALEFSEAIWVKALSLVKQQNNSLYALLRAAQAQAAEDHIQIHFKFQFHRRRLEESKNRSLIESALAKVLGRKVRVEAITAEKTTQPTASEDQDALSNVLNILGGEVVRG